MENAASLKLFVVGLSYKTAPVAVREQIALSRDRLRCGSCRLKIAGALSEVVVLSTCNRVEIYGVASRLRGRLHSLFNLITDTDIDLRPHLYVHEGPDAVRHLFSVAGGLDSMVLGETEITGQVKQAYQAAQEAKLTGRVLNRLFQSALQAGKEIRTRTQVGRGATSVGSVAVELAEKIFAARLARHSIMIIGAGKMGEACLKHLTKKGAASVTVANRSLDRARELAAEFGGRAIPFDECLAAMNDADIVISSTGATQAILNRRDIQSVMDARRQRPLFLIDIAVPRDIDPEVQSLGNVYLYNIDHLEDIVRENVRQREHELTHCDAILRERIEALWPKLQSALQPASLPAPALPPQPAWALLGTAPCRG